jgi:hypothetical protein
VSEDVVKVVGIGNLRVMLDDRGEGEVRIERSEKLNDRHTLVNYVTLTRDQLQDLRVALDAIEGDMKPPADDEPTLHKIRREMQALAHKLYVHGIRHRLEMHVETWVLHDLAFAAKQKIVGGLRPDRESVSLDGYGYIVATRGTRLL